MLLARNAPLSPILLDSSKGRLLSQHRAPIKAIVLVSNFDDPATFRKMKSVGDTLSKAGILVFSLIQPPSLTVGGGRTVQNELLSRTGGLAFKTLSRELPSVAAKTAKLLRFRYVVDYLPPDDPDRSAPHRVKVKIRKDIAGEKCTVIANPYRFE